MIGARQKDRIEVDDGDAQLLEIGQLLAHALQIAAVEIVGEIVAVFGDIEEGHLVPFFMQALALARLEQRVGALTVTKAVHHDLIHDAAGHPLGHLVVLIVDGDLEVRGAVHPALAAAGVVLRAEHIARASVRHLEAVPAQAGRLGHGDLRLIKEAPRAQAERTHRIAMLRAIPCAQLHTLYVLPAAQRDAQAHLRAGLQRAEGSAIKRIR